MIKNIAILTIFFLLFGCNSAEKEKKKSGIENEIFIKVEEQVESKTEIQKAVVEETEIQEVSKNESLKKRINGLKSGCFDKSMRMIFADNGKTKEVVNEIAEDWIFGLETKDSLQFESADSLRPLCKIDESNEIVSVAFSDFADYKEAIHIFNIRKSDFKPISSFILYSIGGDAEQFWSTTYEKMDNWTYKIIEAEGHYEFDERKTTSIIEKQKTKTISIDKSTGKLVKKLIETE